MLRILEFLTGFYWILIPQFIIEGLFRTRGRTANSSGTLGESIRSALSLNSATLYVDMYGAWSGHHIKRLLAAYDIPMWGWGYAFEQFYFHVPLEDAETAYRVLLMAGVDLVN